MPLFGHVSTQQWHRDAKPRHAPGSARSMFAFEADPQDATLRTIRRGATGEASRRYRRLVMS